MTRTTLWKIADGLMLVLFGLSVAVQYNDPDPLAWMVVYGAAAVACLLSLRGRGHRPLAAVVGLGALVWAARMVPDVIGKVPFADMFGAFEMESVAVERSREMYGLVLIAAWMAVLLVRGRVRVEPTDPR